MTAATRLSTTGGMLLVWLVADTVHAQRAEDSRVARFDRAQAATQTPAAGGVTTGTGVVAPSILATVVNKDKLARASVGTTRGKGNVEWNPWLALSGALDENDATAPVVLADLSGMRAATKAALGVNTQHWRWINDTDAQERLCRAYFQDTLLVLPSLRPPIRAALQMTPDAARDLRLREVADSLAGKQCNTGSFVRPEERRALLRQADFGRIYLLGAGVEYGRQTYKYADTASATFTSQTESPFAAVVGGGVYFPTSGVLAAATLRVERSFTGGTPRQFCVRTGADPSLECRTVALAAPGESEPVLVSAEMRWFANSSVGISPRVTTDLRGKMGTGVEFPIMLRQAADDGFSTALALGWRSKKTDPSTDDRAYISLTVGVNYGIGLTLLR